MGEGGRWEEGKSLLLGHFMKQHLIQQIKLLNHTDVTAVIFLLIVFPVIPTQTLKLKCYHFTGRKHKIYSFSAQMSEQTPKGTD